MKLQIMRFLITQQYMMTMDLFLKLDEIKVQKEGKAGGGASTEVGTSIWL